jgi:serine phosphatase RsbU (regulator of sigma subunit)
MSAADIVPAALRPASARPTPPAAIPVRSGGRGQALVEAGSVERFSRITTMAQRLLGIADAAIEVVEDDGFWTIAPTERRGRAGVAIGSGSAPLRHELLVVPDLVVDDRFPDALLSALRPGVRAYARQPLLGPGGELVGALSVADPRPREFTAADLQTLRELARWAEEELQLAAELARSAQVQRSMLPASLVSFPGWEVAGRCSPLRAVAGDFYDWYPVRGGAAITLADVMGKGMPAALIAANVRAVMRSTSPVNGVAAAVESAAETLETDLDGAGVFVTLFHAHLHEQTGVLRYIDAGHGLTLVLHEDGTTERLAPTGLPLGAGWENSWDERTVRLLPGDVLVSVSDGVLDAFDGTLESLHVIERIARSCTTASAIVDAVTAAVAGEAPDDVSVVALRRSDVPRFGGR